MIPDLALTAAERLSGISYKAGPSQSAPELVTTQKKLFNMANHLHGASGDAFNFLRCRHCLAFAFDGTLASIEEPHMDHQVKITHNLGLSLMSHVIECVESEPIFNSKIEIIIIPTTPIVEESNEPFFADHIHKADKESRYIDVNAAQLHPH